MPAERPDYMEAIYRNQTRNRLNVTEPTKINLPASAFATLPPSFVAQPFLKKSDFKANNANSMQAGAQPKSMLGQILTEQKRQWASNAQLGKCSPASMILSCGPQNNWCQGTVCDESNRLKPQSGMDNLSNADGDNQWTLSTAIDPARARRPTISETDAQGSNNAFLANYSQFVYQNEKERMLRQYNIGLPPFPKPCPEATPLFGNTPRYDAVTGQGNPIHIPEQVFEQKNNCGCNHDRIQSIYACQSK